MINPDSWKLKKIETPPKMQSLKLFFVAIVVLALSVLITGQSSQAGYSNPQRSVPPKTIEGDGTGICPPEEDLEAVRSEIRQEIQTLLEPTITCGGTTGWTLHSYINASNSSEQCPSPLIAHVYNGQRVCGRDASITARISCTSVTLQGNRNQSYNEVCGKIIGYQYGGTQAFGYYAELRRNNPPNTIDEYYVDGVTLTYRSLGSRQHIWTFATGIAESHREYACPCSPDGTGVYNAIPPPFVGDDYFCESGHPGTWGGSADENTFFGSDPLWDGAGCSAGNTCCALNNPPYFTKQLPMSTTDDIEMRICGRETTATTGDTLIQIIELYVK